MIALEERTYLTIVFALAPRSRFKASFASAVANALTDLGTAQAVADTESTAIEFAALVRLTSRTMAGSLNDLEFHCGIELEYHDDLRRVQRNLNDMPHANRDPCVPVDAVRQLLGAV